MHATPGEMKSFRSSAERIADITDGEFDEGAHKGQTAKRVFQVVFRFPTAINRR
jgi:hypothetical protein